MGLKHSLLLKSSSFEQSGDVKFQQKDYRGAIKDYVQSLQLTYNENALLKKGIARIHLGNYIDLIEAIEDFDSILRINPINVSALENRSYANLALGNNKKAIDDFTKVLDLDPDNSKVLNHRAILYRIMGEIDKANCDIQKARPIEAKQDLDKHQKVEEHLARAKREITQPNCNLKTALIYCNEAIRLQKENPDAHVLRIQINNMMDEHQKSEIDRTQLTILTLNRNSIEKINAGDPASALDDLNKVLYLDPDNEEALLNRGIAKCRFGKYEDAVEDFNVLIHLNPTSSDAFANRGWAKLVLGHFDDSLVDCSRALELNTDNLFALKHQRMLHHIRKQLDEAHKDLEILIPMENKQNISEVFREQMFKEYLACATREMQKENGNGLVAYLCCTEAIALQKSNPQGFYCRAEVNEMVGRHERAEKDRHHAKTLELNKNASKKSELKEYAEALEICKEALLIKPDAIDILMKSAMANFCTGNMDKALKDVTTCIDICPHETAYLSRSWFNTWRGNYRDAIDDLTRALDLSPNDTLSLNHRAMLYQIKGEREKAKNDIQKARYFENGEYNVPDNCIKSYLNITKKEIDNKEKSLDAAFVFCNEAIRVNNKYSDAYLYRADIYDMVDRHEKAKADRYYAKILTTYPDILTELYAAIVEDQKNERSVAFLTLLEHFPLLSTQTIISSNQNAFMLAIIHKPSNEHERKLQHELLELLFKRHIDIHVKDHQGFTALHWAVQTGQIGVVKLLLAKGARVDQKIVSVV